MTTRLMNLTAKRQKKKENNIIKCDIKICEQLKKMGKFYNGFAALRRKRLKDWKADANGLFTVDN